MPNPLVGYGKVYNSYVREREVRSYVTWHVNIMSLMRSVCVTKYKLFICSKYSGFCRVSCTVRYRPIALETTDLVASSMHLILNARAECIAKDM